MKVFFSIAMLCLSFNIASASYINDEKYIKFDCPEGGVIFMDKNIGINREICVFNDRYYSMDTGEEILELKNNETVAPYVDKTKLKEDGLWLSKSSYKDDDVLSKIMRFKFDGFNFGFSYGLEVNARGEQFLNNPSEQLLIFDQNEVTFDHNFIINFGYLRQVKKVAVGFHSNVKTIFGNSFSPDYLTPGINYGSQDLIYSPINNYNSFIDLFLKMGGVVKDRLMFYGGVGASVGRLSGFDTSLINYESLLINTLSYYVVDPVFIAGLEFLMFPFASLRFEYAYVYHVKELTKNMIYLDTANNHDLEYNFLQHELSISLNFYI